MKLKPVVASIFLLGLSGTALAATNGNVQARLDAMQSQINDMQQIINHNNTAASTNGGTSLQSTLATSSHWYDAIAISGVANVDMIASNHTTVTNNPLTIGFPSLSLQPTYNHYGHGSATDVELSNATLFADAQVNDWTKAHLAFNYQSSESGNSLVTKNHYNDTLKEGYVTIANFTESPLFFRAGKQLVNFGDYQWDSAVPSFTQLLSQTTATAATLGVVSNGLYGSIFGFRGTPEMDAYGTTTNVNNFGANLGFTQRCNDFGFNVSASYLNNMVDVDYVGSTRNSLGFLADLVSPGISNHNSAKMHDYYYGHKVGALSVDAAMNVNIFDASAHMVTALNDFSEFDLMDISESNHHLVKGARPKALTVGAGVNFDMIGHRSRFGIDYQRSWEAAQVGSYGLPEQRYEATLDVEVSKNVKVGFNIFKDRDYAVYDGGSDKDNVTGLVRLGVMFG